MHNVSPDVTICDTLDQITKLGQGTKNHIDRNAWILDKFSFLGDHSGQDLAMPVLFYKFKFSLSP